MAYLVSLFFILAGLNHFYMEDFYMRIMPAYLPYPKLLIAISGFFELFFGILLLFEKWKRFAKTGLILLLLAVFPANIEMALNPQNFPEFSQLILWLRLPVQFLFIYLVMKV